MRIGLLGGSFNPPHRGHVHASELALRQLALDAVWWLVSPQNPLKPARGMANFDERIRAARRFVRQRRILVSDIEDQLGTRFTADTLEAVTRRFPQARFVWLMGTDNLVQLPKWRRWQTIFRLVPIAAVARPGSTASARNSLAARRFAFAWRSPSRRFANLPLPAWTILEGRRDPTSASAIRSASTPGDVLRKPGIEERLSSAILGPVAELHGPVLLEPYSAEWPARYAELRSRIVQALGSTTILIEHVGSTSVPGLAAKPVIDIVLGVPDSADEPAYVPAMQRAGFMLRIRELDWFEHRMFKSSLDDANIHVFSSGCAEIGRMLLLRDWLRGSDADRQLYEATKRRLAAQSWRFLQEYADAKSAVIAGILTRAARGPGAAD